MITRRRINLDLDVLRSFAVGVELGSFAKAAERLGRSTSAVSAQLKKLEQQAGAPVLRREGRGMALTEAGELMLAYARRLLDLNDEAVAALQAGELAGTIRLGLQEDFGESLLPEVLGRFARAHPRLRIEVRIARNAELLAAIATDRLDLALAWGDPPPAGHFAALGALPLCWIGAADRPAASWRAEDEPLPLVMLDTPCLFRSQAIAALDRAGIRWRIAFTSASLAGAWAAVAAGLGVGLRTPIGLPARLCVLAPARAGLPAMDSLGLCLHRANAEAPAAVTQLATIIQRELRGLFAQAGLATPARRRRAGVR